MFFVDQCYDFRHVNPDPDALPNTCEASIFTSMATAFLALAVILNINKWVYFTLRIQAQINIREYQIAEMVAEEQEEMLEQ